MTTITRFTKEQLIARADHQLCVGKAFIAEHPEYDGMAKDVELFNIALSSLTAEPVGEFYHEKRGGWYQISEGDKVPDNRRIPLYTATPAPVVDGEYGDAYQGAREDLTIWKRRALEAEEHVRRLEQINDHLVKEAQGESRMGEPVIREPVPVVPEEMLSAMEEVLRISERDHEAWHKVRNGIASCRAAMLQGSQPVSNRDELLPSIKPAPELDSVAKNAKSLPSKSPIIPDGYVVVPKRLTAENFAKVALSGEFSETKFINCPECFGDDECETCDGSGRIEIKVTVSWTNIKAIWAKGVELFAAAPQQEVKS